MVSEARLAGLKAPKYALVVFKHTGQVRYRVAVSRRWRLYEHNKWHRVLLRVTKGGRIASRITAVGYTGESRPATDKFPAYVAGQLARDARRLPAEAPQARAARKKLTASLPYAYSYDLTGQVDVPIRRLRCWYYRVRGRTICITIKDWIETRDLAQPEMDALLASFH